MAFFFNCKFLFFPVESGRVKWVAFACFFLLTKCNCPTPSFFYPVPCPRHSGLSFLCYIITRVRIMSTLWHAEWGQIPLPSWWPSWVLEPGLISFLPVLPNPALGMQGVLNRFLSTRIVLVFFHRDCPWGHTLEFFEVSLVPSIEWVKSPGSLLWESFGIWILSIRYGEIRQMELEVKTPHNYLMASCLCPLTPCRTTLSFRLSDSENRWPSRLALAVISLFSY